VDASYWGSHSERNEPSRPCWGLYLKVEESRVVEVSRQKKSVFRSVRYAERVSIGRGAGRTIGVESALAVDDAGYSLLLLAVEREVVRGDLVHPRLPRARLVVVDGVSLGAVVVVGTGLDHGHGPTRHVGGLHAGCC